MTGAPERLAEQELKTVEWFFLVEAGIAASGARRAGLPHWSS